MNIEITYYKLELDSFYGYLEIGYTKKEVISLRVVNEIINEQVYKTGNNNFIDEVITQIDDYFKGTRKNLTFPISLKGTEFQMKVWETLRSIPYGEVRTYKEIATCIGNEKASRAVGMANNRNPIILAVPCHRVIGGNGDLVGYSGGLEFKKFLLDLEKVIL